MKIALVLAAALLTAAPVVSFPSAADAQVLTGRGRATPARRPSRPPPPALTEAEEDRLWDAEAELASLEEQMTALETPPEGQTALSAEQQTQLQAHATRLREVQTVIAQLKAKRDRQR
ncbi:MAG TPA: hypothetical protein VGB60_10900 [Brevundimonas sp.]|jgi:hypothetical protein|uniref:hypothetical protein n=1 Tax=Brevundimonas sp. TaxID=1871086 RepID=UPI002ED8722F